MLTARAQDLKQYLYICVFSSILICIAAGILLTGRTEAFKFTVSVSIVTALLTLSTIPFFLSGLKNFKDQAKKAYIVLCIGMGIFGLAQVQIPIITFFELFGWVNSGGAPAVYIISVVPMLLAMRMFAKQMQIKSIWSSLSLCIGLALVSALAVSFLPHVKVSTPEFMYDFSQAIVVWNGFFVFFAGMLTLKILRVTSQALKASFAWLAAGFFTITLAGIHFFVVALLLTDGDLYYDFSFTILPFGVGALLFLISGYKFSVQSFGGNNESGEKVNEIDVITYVASLATKPQEINDIIESISGISAQLIPGQSLTSEQSKMLRDIYIKLQQYLASNDALVSYSPQDLHIKIEQKFGGAQNLQNIGFLKN